MASANANDSSNTNNNDSNNLTVNSQAEPETSRAVKPQVQRPWTKIVSGGSEPAEPEPQRPRAENGSGMNNNNNNNNTVANNSNNDVVDAVKKPAWNKPLPLANGSAGPAVVAVAVTEGGTVMGTAWPTLVDSAKVSSKSDLSKSSSEGSSSVVKGTGGASAYLQKQVNHNANPNATSNHVPAQQRSMKRNGSNSSFNGGPQHQHISAPSSPSANAPPSNPSPRNHSQRSGFTSYSHSGHDHPQQRNAYRIRNGGSHPRGDGSHHHHYGSRRDHNRGNQDWGSHQNFNGKDAHMQSHRGGPRLVRPSLAPLPNSAPFMHHPPMRPYGVPMSFPEMVPPFYYPPLHPDSLKGMAYVAPMAPYAMYMGAMDPELPHKIVKQVDYYFSNDNLIRDVYLRQRMDNQGLVPINLIAGFKRVRELTDDIQLILDALRSSDNVEVQGDKVRKREEWGKWIIPPLRSSNSSRPQSPGASSSQENLSTRVQSLSLEERATVLDQIENHVDARSSSGEANINSEGFTCVEVTGQVAVLGSSDRSF